MSCSGMQNVFDTWNKSPFNTPFSFITKLLSVIDIISSIFSHSLKKKRVNSWTRNSHLRILFWLLKRFHAWTAICTYHKKYYTSHFAPYITVLNLNTHKTQNGHIQWDNYRIQVLFLYHYNTALSMLFQIYCVSAGVLVPQGLETQVHVWMIQKLYRLILETSTCNRVYLCWVNCIFGSFPN